ncbi:hypothetical protein F4774DRAFT_418011 [Daldinia eschscholtzii]|nr:hypothetical protein F4774DRAFT_418011 [Daldinia eschscholtzii]
MSYKKIANAATRPVTTYLEKTVLVTGCNDGGIDAESAIVLQQSRFHVFATARDPSKMSSLSGLPNIAMLTLDVVKPADIKAAVESVSKETGGTLNYSISNTGRNHFMPILDEDLDIVRNLFEINFLAPIDLTQAFAPILIKARGMAVYITSISGYLNIPYVGTYTASKRSLEIVTETLRLELAPLSVDTYFGNFNLPEQSLYKSIEDVVAMRAQGKEGEPRMETREYATGDTGAVINA